ncbi:MAG: histidine kinase [Clostridia bacterium]|nr:histidine kinase [Clostridia bacterium]
MRTKYRDLPIQIKMTIVYVAISVVVLAVNLTLLLSINSVLKRLEMTYQDNLNLNEITLALDEVQNAMTEYLNVKTTDALENYYKSDENYRSKINDLESTVSSSIYTRMERNIKYMSEEYLTEVSQTIEAKRGRNVEKYRIGYEKATELYDYIGSYIASLNGQQFIENSQTFVLLSRDLRITENVSVFIMILVIITNILVILQYSSQITRPLKTLAISADEVAKGNFDIELTPAESKDEVGVVTSAFNQMVISIRDYIERIKESMENERRHKETELMMETHLKDAQIKYLQAQINPHFLFNSLNAGAQLAMMEEADRTYEYIQNMSEFFRYNLKKADSIITLREEIELVDHYIFIINVRFSGDVKFQKDIDEELIQASIPSMILQPIVENCVNHGIREMAGEGVITLKVFKIMDSICISIKDNGKGMTQETIDKLLNGTYRDDGLSMDSNGIGMDNVINRLRLFLGQDDIITITSEGENKGTEVRIYLPLGDGEV